MGLARYILPGLMLFSYGVATAPEQAAPHERAGYTAAGMAVGSSPAATARQHPAPAPVSDIPTDIATVPAESLPELSDLQTGASPFGFVSDHMRALMAQALTPGQVARTLQSFSATGAGNVAGDVGEKVVRSFIDQGWERLGNILQGDFFRSINLNWQPAYGDREDIVQVDAVMSLWEEGGRHSLFSQAGLQSRGGDSGFNVGLGYRTRPLASLLVGVNVFYDYLSDPEVSRYSVGLEARGRYVDVTGNWYRSLSDDTLSADRTAYSPDGYDLEFVGRLPEFPHLEATGRYYNWDVEDRQSRDLEGMEYGFRYIPVPLFTLEGRYDNTSGGSDDKGVEAQIQYRFGVPLRDQLRSENVHLHTPEQLWQRRFERVRRQYEQRVQYRERRAPQLRVISLGNGVRLRIPMSAVPAGTERVIINVREAGILVITPPLDVRRTDLTPDGDLYTHDVTIPNFQSHRSYEVTVSFRDMQDMQVGTDLTGHGPGLFIGETAGANEITGRFRRLPGAPRAALSWTPVLVAPIVTGAGALPSALVETGQMDFVLTDSLCPQNECPFTIPNLQSGTEYRLVLDITGADGQQEMDSVNLTTTGSRPDTAVTVSASPATISEGGSSGTITLSASPASIRRSGISVPFTITGANITPEDYSLTDASGRVVDITQPLRIEANETEVALTLTASINADGASETMTETMTVRLSDPVADAGYTLGTPREASVTINPLPMVSFASATATVAEDTAGPLTLTVQLSSPPDRDLAIAVTTSDGTATAGEDYTALSAQTVMFTAGAGGAGLTQTVSVSITDDGDDELDETFTVGFDALPPGVAAGAPNEVTVTITDDDVPAVTVRAAPATVSEGGSISLITLSVAPVSIQDISVPFTLGGTAVAADYTLTDAGGSALSSPVAIPANTGSLVLRLQAVTDTDDTETTETLTVTLSSPVANAGYELGTPAAAEISISPSPAVSFIGTTATVSEGTATVSVMVNLSDSPVGTVTIPVTTSDGTATAGEDYTALSAQSVTFAAGAGGADLTQTVSVSITDDSDDEPDETFTVGFGALPAGVIAGTPDEVTVTITDDDVPVVNFASGTARVSEGTATVSVSVSLDRSPVGNLTIPVTTSDGTASAGSDYTALSAQSVTFTAGAGGAGLTQTVTVSILDDSANEGNETFTVGFGTLPAGVTAGTPDEVRVTITDDDVPVVDFASATATVAEDAGTVSVSVSLDRSPGATLSIPITTSDVTATAGEDYTALSAQSVTFAAGASGADLTQTVSVSITDDSDDEPDETFTVGFGTLPSDVVAGTPDEVTVTITDNDDATAIPVVSFASATATVAEDAGTVSVSVSLDRSPAGNLTIPVSTSDGTATAGEDYTALSAQSVMFTAGASGADLTQTVSVSITDDSDDESDETFTVGFGTLTGVTAGTPDEVTVTITDDDGAPADPVVSFDAATATVAEDAGTVSVSVSLDRSPAGNLAIPVMTSDGTATAGSDYTALSAQTVTFTAGASGADLTQTVSVSITDDSDDEPDETFTVGFGALPAGVTAGTPDEVTVTITDDDVPVVTVRAAPATISEGGLVSLITLSVAPVSIQNISVPFTLGGTAVAADYTLTDTGGSALSSPVAIPANTGSLVLRLQAVADTDDTETTETLTVTLSSPVTNAGYELGAPAAAEISISPSPAVSFIGATATVAEDAGTVSVMVNLSDSPVGTVTIPVTTSDGTATAGEDYTALTTQSVMFTAGASGADLTQTVTVSILDDSANEGNETFTVGFGTLPAGVTEGTPNEVTVTITDDDIPVASFASGTATVAEDAGTVSLTVGLDISPAQEVTIPVTTSDGTARAGSDYTALSTQSVTFAMGASGAGLTQTVSVSITDDSADEPDETFTVGFGTLPAGVTVGTPDEVTVTITDDDVPVASFASGTATVAEDAGTVSLTVGLDISPAQGVTIPVTTSDGTATAGQDYTALGTQSVTFTAGASGADLMQTVSVSITDDSDDEPDETFTVGFGALPAGVTAGTPDEVTVTITDDDVPVVTVRAAPATISEGGLVSLITLSVAPVSIQNISVPFTLGGTAVAADYTLTDTGGSVLSSPVAIPANTGSLVLRLQAVADTDDTETTETLTVTLSNPVTNAGYELGAPAAATISISPSPAVSFIGATATVSEGTATVSVMVNLSDSPMATVTIPVTTSDGTATAGEDYTALSTQTVTFTAGASGAGLTQTVTVSILDDNANEGNETFTVGFGTLPSSVTEGTPNEVTVTITDDDIPVASFASGTATVAEDAGTVSLTVRLDISPAQEVTIPVTTSDGTARAGQDYTALTTQSVTFAMGASGAGLMQTVSVSITDDSADEPDETFTVGFGALPAGVTAGTPDEVTVTITDDDVPVVDFANGTATVAEGTATVSMSVSLDRSPVGSLTIPVTTSDGTATAGQDYTALSAQSVTFTAGASGADLMQTVSVSIMDDSADEPDETFTVGFGALPAGVTAGTPNEVTVTITDDDVPVVNFASGTATVAEGAGTVSLTVGLDISPAQEVTIPVTTSDGTATAGQDYTALTTQSVTFTAGASGAGLMQTVSVSITDDSADESDETFTVGFGTLPAGVTAGTPNEVTVTITDDDVPVVNFASGTATVAEGTATVSVSVSLDRSPVGNLTIPVTTSDGTATAGQDYTALTTQNVTFTAGASGAGLMQTVSVSITDDSADEPDETFTVGFGALPAGVTAGTPNEVTVTITDDDVPVVNFASGTATVAEGAGTVSLTVQLDISPAQGVTIPVTTSDGTATAGQDYTALTTQNVTFAMGASGAGLMQTVSVSITDDSADEPDETFTVGFGALPAGVTEGTTNEVTVTITDDDVPVVNFASGTATVAEGAGTVSLTVQLDTSPAQEVTIPVRTSDGTATAGQDYTALTTQSVTFAMGASGAGLMQTVSVSITDDSADESDETFTVGFGTLPAGVTEGTLNEVTVTITDDDDAPVVNFASGTATVAEGAGTVSLTVQLDTSPVGNLTIPVTTSDGTATAGQDYTALTTQNVTFTAGASGAGLMQTVSVSITDDSADESDETFTVGFGTLPAGVTEGTLNEVTVTITDDDVPVVNFASGTATVAEGAGTVSLTVQLDISPVGNLTIPVTTSDGTATAGQDYTALTTQNVTFTAGASGAGLMQTVSVSITDDSADESDETFTVGFGTLPAGVTEGTLNEVTVTITDDDMPVAPGAPTGLMATAAGQTQIDLSWMAPAGTGGTITGYRIEVSTDGGTTFNDLVANTGSAATTYNHAGLSASTTRHYRVSAINAVGPGTASAVAMATTFSASGAPAVSFASATASAAEGTATVSVSVRLSASPAMNVVIPVTTSDGTARAGEDYTALTTQSVTFTPTGALTQTVSISITDDNVDDDDETFTVGFGMVPAPVTAGAPSSVTVTITDNDDAPTVPAVSFGSSTLTVAEDAGTVSLAVNLALPTGTTSLANAVTIPVRTRNGTATAGEDYTALTTQSVTFAMGASGAGLMQTVSVSITNDGVNEADEMFSAWFGTLPAGVVEGNMRSVTVTITDDDVPEITMAAVPATIDEDASSTITLTADIAPFRDLALAFTVTGTGVTDADYTLTSGGMTVAVAAGAGTIMFPAGQSSVTATLTAVNDADTVAETLTFALSTPGAGAGYTVGTAGSAAITISALVSQIGINIRHPTIRANTDTAQNTATIDFTVNPSLSAPATVGYTTTGTLTGVSLISGTQSAALAATGTVTLSANAGSQEFLVRASASSVAGAIVFTLSDPSGGYTVDAANKSVTITVVQQTMGTATNPHVSLIADSPRVLEGGMARLTLNLSPAPTNAVNVGYAVSGDVDVNDYYIANPSSGITLGGSVLSVSASQTSVSFDLVANTNTDTDDTAMETLTFTLQDSTAMPVTYTPAAPKSVSLTVDPGLSLTVTWPTADTIAEGAHFDVTFALSPVPAQAVTVAYRLTNLSAHGAGTDYTISGRGSVSATHDSQTGGGTITLPSGQASSVIRVSANTDAIVEAASEEFDMEFTSPLLNPSTITEDFHISDATAAPVIRVEDASVSEDAGTVDVTLSLSHAFDPSLQTRQRVRVMTTAGGTAPAADYTGFDREVSFLATERTRTLTMALAVNDNAVADGGRTVTVTPSLPTGASLLRRLTFEPGTITITDDEPAAEISVETVSFIEEGDTAANAFTIRVNEDVSASFTVRLRTTDAMNSPATSGTDYTAIDRTVTFAALEREKTVALATVEDTDQESLERIGWSLTVTNDLMGRVRLATGSGAGTIDLDDDDAPVLLSLTAPSNVMEGDGATATASVTVLATGAIGSEFTVEFYTDAVTESATVFAATAGGDYTTTTQTLTFPASTNATTSMTAAVTIAANDNLLEGAEVFRVGLRNVGGAGAANVGVGRPVQVTIGDRDAAASQLLIGAQYTVGFFGPVPGARTISEGADLTVSYVGLTSASTPGALPAALTVARGVRIALGTGGSGHTAEAGDFVLRDLVIPQGTMISTTAVNDVVVGTVRADAVANETDTIRLNSATELSSLGLTVNVAPTVLPTVPTGADIVITDTTIPRASVSNIRLSGQSADVPINSDGSFNFRRGPHDFTVEVTLETDLEDASAPVDFTFSWNQTQTVAYSTGVLADTLSNAGLRLDGAAAWIATGTSTVTFRNVGGGALLRGSADAVKRIAMESRQFSEPGDFEAARRAGISVDDPQLLDTGESLTVALTLTYTDDAMMTTTVDEEDLHIVQGAGIPGTGIPGQADPAAYFEMLWGSGTACSSEGEVANVPEGETLNLCMGINRIFDRDSRFYLQREATIQIEVRPDTAGTADYGALSHASIELRNPMGGYPAGRTVSGLVSPPRVSLPTIADGSLEGVESFEIHFTWTDPGVYISNIGSVITRQVNECGARAPGCLDGSTYRFVQRVSILPAALTATFERNAVVVSEGVGRIEIPVLLNFSVATNTVRAVSSFGGTATAGSSADYQKVCTDGMDNLGLASCGSATQFFIWAPGERRRLLVLDIRDDSTMESDETITFTINNFDTVVPSVLPTVTVTIVDND